MQTLIGNVLLVIPFLMMVTRSRDSLRASAMDRSYDLLLQKIHASAMIKEFRVTVNFYISKKSPECQKGWLGGPLFCIALIKYKKAF